MPCTAAEMATLVESIGAASAEIVCHQGAAQTASAALSQGASRGLLEGGLARAMQEGFSGYTGEVALLASSVDVMFMLFCAYLVFLMQARGAGGRRRGGGADKEALLFCSDGPPGFFPGASGGILARIRPSSRFLGSDATSVPTRAPEARQSRRDRGRKSAHTSWHAGQRRSAEETRRGLEQTEEGSEKRKSLFISLRSSSSGVEGRGNPDPEILFSHLSFCATLRHRRHCPIHRCQPNPNVRPLTPPSHPQAGFAMLCAGAVRSKNTVNILLKNVMDACGGALAYWLLGFGFAYGVCGDDKTGNAFIGCGQFAMSGDFSQYQQYSFWLFQWAFAAAASTITVGSIAERTHFVAYLVFSVFLSAWVYPVVSHWVWDSSGWLSSFKDDPFLTVGVIDFAGCGVVHMVGGLAGLAGAVLVGPRTGRFDAMGFPINLPGHSATLLCLGTFLLWFGWYGFNPGSMLMISTPAAALVVARSAATTTLSAAGGGIAQLILCRWQSGAWDMINVCNGLLTGLVSITAAAPVVEPWAAVIIGAIGAVIFNYGGKLLLRLQIDDPLEAVNMHAFGGAWGLLAVALFAKDTYVAETFSASVAVNGKGIFYGGYKLLGSQIIAIIVISAWTLSWMSALFYGLKQVGYLRVSATDELIGLDQSHHGGSAYPAHATKGPGHSRHGSRHGGEEHEKATGKIDEKDKMLGGDSGPGL